MGSVWSTRTKPRYRNLDSQLLALPFSGTMRAANSLQNDHFQRVESKAPFGAVLASSIHGARPSQECAAQKTLQSHREHPQKVQRQQSVEASDSQGWRSLRFRRPVTGHRRGKNLAANGLRATPKTLSISPKNSSFPSPWLPLLCDAPVAFWNDSA